MNAPKHEPVILTTDGELVHPQSVTGAAPDQPVIEETFPDESGIGRAIRNTLRIWSPCLLSLAAIVYFILFLLNPALSLSVLLVLSVLFGLYHRRYRARVTGKNIGGTRQYIETFFKEMKNVRVPGPFKW